MFVSRRNIMGQFAISKYTTIFAFTMALVLITINIVGFYPEGQSATFYAVVSVAVLLYLGLVGFVATRPVPKIYLEDAPKLTAEEKRL